MSWVTKAIDEISANIKKCNANQAAYARGLEHARTIILFHYVKQAETNSPSYANYANPEDMK